MFLRNAWYAAGWSDTLTDAPTPHVFLNERIILYRKPDGGPVAMEDRCPHRLAPLSQGRCEGENVRCLYHGLLFAPDGRCVEIPGQEKIPDAVRVRTYPIIDRHSVAWIWMGDAALADPDLIPDFEGPQHPDWAMIPGHMDYDAHYELINDNLLDLSHLAWVHAASFNGNNAESSAGWVDTPVKMTVIDRGLRVERWTVNAPLPPFMEGFALSRGDILHSYDFLVPGIFLLKSIIYPTGTFEGLAEGEAPSVAPLHRSFTCQAVTPLTDKRTRYIFGFGPEAANGHLAQTFQDIAIMAFNEDRTMIEAQQKVIDADPSRRMMPLVMDGGPRRYAGVVAKLLKEEADYASV